MIAILFNVVFFILPLVFYTKTSELFEFNKIIVLYIFTILIFAAWLIKSIRVKKFIFKHTILDVPLILFLLSQLISTLISFDPITSIFGYYGRFNGGLISTVCYLILYWAYVSNISRKQTINHLRTILISGLIVSIWAILEHFGASFSCLLITNNFNDSCFIQDVQNRVFATLGQPNWLAAWIIALTPLTWSFVLNLQFKIYNLKKILICFSLIVLTFLTLLFTKSRSGLLGFFIADLVFFIFIFSNKILVKKLLILNCIFLICVLMFGSVFNAGIIKNNYQPKIADQGEGGTESGAIRQIVWKGALQVWQHYPVFGTGVETFAYSYYQFRPVEHNLTSEWDFLYNKAHNEYLNFLANSGALGLITYLAIIFVFLGKNLQFTIYNLQKKINYKFYIINFSLISGYVGLLVTNLFGFSVVVTSFLFFLIPAMAFSLKNAEQNTNYKAHRQTAQQKLLIIFALCTMIYALSRVAGLWYADTLYTLGKNLNEKGEYTKAQNQLLKAVALAPFFANYHDQLATSYTNLGQTQLAENQMRIETELSPYNTNLAKSRIGNLIDLSAYDPKYKLDAIVTLQKLISLAPSDPSSYYRLALVFGTMKNYDQAQFYFEKAIELKPDYEKAQKALQFLKEYLDQKGQ